MKWVPTILIVVFIAIPVFCAWRGYKNGIIRGACGILAIILALFCGNIIANMYGTDFDGMLYPFVNGMVDSDVRLGRQGTCGGKSQSRQNDL